jgi:hypothetical protein
MTPAIMTPIPATALANRNAMGIQNTSGVEIKLNYDPLTVGYVGVVMADGIERFYDISDQIVIYGKASVGSATIGVEELS